MKSIYIFCLIVFAIAIENNGQFNPDKYSATILVGYGGGGLDGTGALPVGFELDLLKINKKMKCGVFMGFASTSEDYTYNGLSGKWTYTSIVLAVKTDYHFYPGKSFDPFFGVSLGYNTVEEKWKYDSEVLTASGEPEKPVADGVFFNGHAGINLWVTQNLAFQVKVGYFPYVAAAVVFGL